MGKSKEFKIEKHHFTLNKNLGKSVCLNCGLILLRNQATDWCVSRGCNYKEHTSYKNAMYALTRKW